MELIQNYHSVNIEDMIKQKKSGRTDKYQKTEENEQQEAHGAQRASDYRRGSVVVVIAVGR